MGCRGSFRRKGFRRLGQATRAACLATLALAQAVAASEPPRIAGATVVSRLHPAEGPMLVATERFHPDGTLVGSAGPAEDPDRYRWTGRWTLDGDRLCLVVPETNTRDCRRLVREGDVVRILRPRGKVGAVPASAVEARLDGTPVLGWTIPALGVLRFRETP